jgi:stress-induced morphogen
MSINIPRGRSDETIEKIVAALGVYEKEHPGAQIDLYRQNPVSVRVRIIDPEFKGQEKPQRNRVVWRYLGQLDEDAQSDISTLLLLAPDETKMSFANFEFDDPVPTQL